jgi:hypothetical protein
MAAMITKKATSEADFLNILFLFASRPGSVGWKGSQKQERRSGSADLPCAGITLIRFYGFDLSLRCLRKHPGNLFEMAGFSGRQVKNTIFPVFVTFYLRLRTTGNYTA